MLVGVTAAAGQNEHSFGVSETLFDAVEREQLCDLLEGVGPFAPTLLGEWTTHDLAAHLVLREHRLLAAPGLVVPGAWGRFAERQRIALKEQPFGALVAKVRSGPPPGFFRINWVRRVPNLNEFFVHHEDVRRVRSLEPRRLAPAEDAALFANVGRFPWFLSRRLRGVGLELSWAGTGQVVRARRGEPAARVEGSPGELLLFLFGRRDVAQVEVIGARQVVEVVQRTAFGM